VGPSLELIDLVNGLHEGLFLFTEFCFPVSARPNSRPLSTFFPVYLFKGIGFFYKDDSIV
ncbi:hypothetical protein, partial [Chitinophaga sp.]|uniref:hypothetical protein n=1 Tax=Chitinophaga sp. TaxID=1869181 RepID=UPI002D1B76EF